jgi:hypothetical protein
MKYWKTDRDKWHVRHPFPEGGFATEREAEAYCVEIRKVHTDKFRPKMLNDGGWTVEQDVP